MFDDVKGIIRSIKSKRTDNPMAKKTKEQTMIYYTTQKTKDRAPRTPLTIGVNSEALEGK